MQSVVVPTEPNQRNFHKQPEKKWCPGEGEPGFRAALRRAGERPHKDVRAGGVKSAVVAPWMATVIYLNGFDNSSRTAASWRTPLSFAEWLD